ncbi:MAG TPA: 2-nitropropane dioxygenase [Rhodospirillaceae bacterium]|nr:2-nitropropane dioxygenase [Rhodospirillaceae bacterium]
MSDINLSSRLKPLMQRGCDFLGTHLAIMGGAMSWISERHLVGAISNAGGFGVLACGSMDPALLRAEIQETQKITRLPFGVNLITMHPQLDELIDVCLEVKVSHIVLAGGIPSAPAIKRIKEGGTKLIWFTPALSLGKRLVKMGADALVIEGMEAGGHIGPVCTSVLSQEVLPHLAEQVPIFVAGGIGRGETMVSYLEMGAAGVQLGTLFVCAKECIAHANFKKAFIRAPARDAIPTTQLDPRFPVIPVRALVNEGTKLFLEKQREVIAQFDTSKLSKEEAQLEIEKFWAGALRSAVIDGDTKNGSVMAGQIVGLIKEELPVREILENLIGQSEQSLLHREL